jgi:exo-1,4-beta-D-glucosaminidase
MIWHLYDFYLRPGGSYFGAKKACEPLHVQLAYDDRSVVVVNGTLEERRGLRATARVLDLASKERFARTEAVDVGADGVVKAFRVPEPAGLTPAYFVFLALDDPAGRAVSRNVYWLSTTPDVLAWDKSEWYVTPVRRHADLTALQHLPPADVKAEARFERLSREGRARVVLENPSPAIAFFVRLTVRKGEGGEEVLPVLWEDNDVTLLPGERREIAASYALSDLGGAAPALAIDGWNVATAPTARRPGRPSPSSTARP